MMKRSHRWSPSLEALETRDLLSAGVLDKSFGVGGIVLQDFTPTFDGARGVAIQADGKIVVAGVINAAGPSSDSQFALARYTSTGKLDPTFGKGGIVETNVSPGMPDGATSVAIQRDGKIVAAGFALEPNSILPGFLPPQLNFVVVRYNSNGTLDTSFGPKHNGEVVSLLGTLSGAALGVVIQPQDGKIVIAGGAATGLSTHVSFLVARFNPNGTLDASFGTGGVTTTDFSSQADVASSLVIQADGKIVLAGAENAKLDLNALSSGNYFPLADSDSQFALARYTPTGHLDPSFGTGGKVTTNFGPRADGAEAVALAPGGKIVAAGVETIRPGTPGVTPGESLYAVAEYTSSGGLVGKVARHYSTTRYGDSALAVAAQSNGDLIVAGEVAITGTESAVVLTRLTPGLVPDNTFGTHGVTITNIIPPSQPFKKEGVAGIRLQADGKIVVVGAARIKAGDTAWAVLRYTT
jgi:uncharacterized delta-60 repeat protein